MHYREGTHRAQVQLMSWDHLVEDDSFARVIDRIVDEMPLEEMGFRNTRLKHYGNAPYDPADMLKLYIYGKKHRISSAQKLADACHVNIEVRWLINNLHPSARKIQYFKNKNKTALRKAMRYFRSELKKESIH